MSRNKENINRMRGKRNQHCVLEREGTYETNPLTRISLWSDCSFQNGIVKAHDFCGSFTYKSHIKGVLRISEDK